ncbi:uncharacterized protein LOC108850128 [Raphanus sativus]|uniref:Uncharacterized protein LOC108850128 n=1 Tax=Raphanus sativus TaxID=3726 RepID=A0A6J0N3H5_RAPSA|nr:uncharacterized protein LOC108850128 [Raphanus sativus]
MARNMLIFEKRTYTAEETAIRRIKLAREWIQAQPPKLENFSSIKTKTSIKTRATLLPHLGQAHVSLMGVTICNTDAAWNNDSHQAGIAWIFSGSTTNGNTSGAQVLQNVVSPLTAEALAVRTAIQVAISSKVSHLRILSDNQTLIRAINDNLFEKEIYGILQDNECFSSLFVDLSFCFLPRAENGQADSLAKAILKNPNFVMGRPTG